MGVAIGRTKGQTATEYMLIISVVVIAVVAAAYKFVPLFQQGVEKLGQDVSEILATGQIQRGGGAGMGSSGTARVASRLCDGSVEDARYEAMFAPPPCAKPAPAPWAPSPDPAPMAPARALDPTPEGVQLASYGSPFGASPAPELPEPAVCREDPVVYLSSARLGRRSRSGSR